MRYLMGIDNGGTFSKAALFDETGNQVSSCSVPVTVLTPAPGYTERDMEELWRSNAAAVRETIGKSGIDPGDIAGVSFSDGSAVYRGILSTDTRAWEYVKKWKENGIREKVFEKSCQDILACQPVSLLAWLRDHEPEVLKRTKYIFMVKDYIRYRLTGEAFAEYSDSTG